MAVLQCNIAKGREVELYDRVRLNDPANSAFVIMILAFPAQALTSLQDHDTFAAILAVSGQDEVTNTNYARKVLTNAEILIAPLVDDTGNRTTLVLPTVTWSGPAPSAGDTWAVGVIGYDSDTTGGTDANIIPVTVFDCINQYGSMVTPDGNPIQFQFSNGWLVAV